MMRLIQIIGEAARKTSRDYRSAYPQIPWREIVGMRHRLVHDYYGISTELVGDVLQTDVPALLQALEPIAAMIEEGQGKGDCSKEYFLF